MLLEEEENLRRLAREEELRRFLESQVSD